MSDFVIDRDASSQKKFGAYLDAYCENMRQACKSMLAHVDEARDNIADSSGQAALDILEQLAQDILDTLPGIQTFGLEQIKHALSIEEAESFKFHR